MNEQLQLTAYAKMKYNISGVIPREVARNYFGALLVIAGADGKLEQEELGWFIEEQRLLGAPEEYLMALQVFDWQNASLDDLLSSIKYEFNLNTRRTLLYQALKTSRADGEYHERERQALWQAAKMLKVEDETVRALENLAEMEENVDRMRHNLLGTTDNDA